MVLRISAVLLFSYVCVGGASSACAEDEVRIELVHKPTVEVRGHELLVNDGEQGTQLLEAKGLGVANISRTNQGWIIRPNSPSGHPPVTLSTGWLLVEAQSPLEVAGRSYYGHLEIRPSAEGGLYVVNRLPLETYLLGVLGSEMSPGWPLEALRAQAVASRTYALQRIKEARSAGHLTDLKATVLSQVYNGADDISNQVKRAVIGTRGEVLVYDRQLAEALFHSTCGGRTASSLTLFGGERSYLVERSCSWCRDSPYYRWKTSISLERLHAALQSSGRVQGGLNKINYRRGDDWVQVGEHQGMTKISLKVFRKHLSWKFIPSDVFRADTRGSTVYFEGQGFGHRVGMCQWGARGMAQSGRTYTTILEHYYPGTYVQRIY
ncbi:MAG: SpoIID/LytB domain-containing protein [Myxococcales bacterium]|nr:SpoIID/LytB domain-containing protein [Myxococcales bacterium]